MTLRVQPPLLRLQPESSCAGPMCGWRPGPQGLAGALQGKAGPGFRSGASGTGTPVSARGRAGCGAWSALLWVVFHTPTYKSSSLTPCACARELRGLPGRTPRRPCFPAAFCGQAFLKQEDKYIKYVASYLRCNFILRKHKLFCIIQL